MLSIKSHYRHKSQQNFILKAAKKDKIEGLCKIKQNDELLQKIKEKSLESTQRMKKKSKIQGLRQTLSSRNSMDNLFSDRFSNVQSHSFKNELKKYNKTIQDLTFILSEVCKQLSSQLYKNKVLRQLHSLIKIQKQSQQNSDASFHNTNNFQDEQSLIAKQKSKLQKISDQKNKIISQNKKLLEEIQNERKTRLLFEGYFYFVQRQIKKYQAIYSSLLIKSLHCKFLYLMTSSNDVVSNGHVLGLRKQNQEEDEKELNRNTYMCLPTRKSNMKLKQDENESTRKSSKCIGKKGTIKKLVKIFNFVQSSKALQKFQLSLYEQQEDLQSNRSRYFTSIHTLRETKEVSLIDSQQKNNLLRRKFSSKSPRCNPRSGKILSIKFITDIDSYYEGNFDEIVYELFRVYQSLGINIFAKNSDKELTQGNNAKNKNKNEDFFNFDQDELVNQSSRRINYVAKSLQKMAKFNDLLNKKIKLVEQNIVQTENYITELQKKILKDKQKVTYEDQQSSNEQAESNKNIFQVVANLMGVESISFNSQKEIENIVERLLDAQKQTKREKIIRQEKQNNKSNKQNGSSQSITKKDNFPQTFNSFDTKNYNYIKSVTKTEGNNRKFHPLIINNDDKTLNNPSRSCRSIFENGMKSLNNIFDNMKTCQSYQRAFEREEFRTQYTKEITKKKRVMFRRQAKVVSTLIQ